jgi:CubicO group peptidase (beta-lactamase class C family)
MRPVVLAVVTTLFGCAVGFAQLTTETRAAIDQAVEKATSASRIPSVSIAVVKDDKLAYAKAYGYSNLESKTPATTAMRYKMGSNSKQITAATILLLSKDGKISLDDRVARFFPNLTRANEVTIRELLSHTSGYEDYYALDYVAPYMMLATTPMKIVDTWGKKPLNFNPGTKWQYSNTNYAIAGAAVEKVTGKPFIETVRERILAPLGMKSAIDLDKQPWSKGDPVGYTRFALGPSRPAIPEGTNWVFAAGELAMSPSDMAKWNMSLINGSILSPDLLRELTTEVHLKNGAGTGYGLGLGIRSADGHRIWQHGGGVSGFISANTTYPDERMAITVFTNQDDPAAHEIAGSIERILREPAVDPNSGKYLALVKNIYAQLSAGKLDRSLFTSDANAYLTNQAVADYGSSLSPLGAVLDFKETSATERGGMSYRYYRVQTKSKPLTLSTFFMPDGKVDQFLVYPSPSK